MYEYLVGLTDVVGLGILKAIPIVKNQLRVGRNTWFNAELNESWMHTHTVLHWKAKS